jgi:hypothetical protein
MSTEPTTLGPVADAAAAKPTGLRPPGSPPSWESAIPEAPEVLEAAPVARPWYRRRLTWVIAAAALVLGATAAGLIIGLGVFTTGPAGPGAQLARDGYPVTETLSKDQLGQLGMFDSADGAALKPFIVGAAAGIKGGREEAVIQFTPDYAAAMRVALSGKPGTLPPGVLSGLLGALPQGVTAHMGTGPFLVIAGPQSVMDGGGS